MQVFLYNMVYPSPHTQGQHAAWGAARLCGFVVAWLFYSIAAQPYVPVATGRGMGRGVWVGLGLGPTEAGVAALRVRPCAALVPRFCC